MQAEIVEFLGFERGWETDHTEMDMQKIIGMAHYEVAYPDGSKEVLFTGLRPGENNAWNEKVIAAAQGWRNQGGVIEPYAPPTQDEIRAVMKNLTARQFRLGLLQAGRSPDQVEAAIAAITDEAERSKAKIEWEYASEFQRQHPLIESVSAALGLSPEDVDTLWNEALTL